MPVGFIQLLAVGNEYQYLHENPHISFFKSTYKRYTNFYTITDELFKNNKKDDHIIIFDIPKKGDLLSKFYIKFKVKDNYTELLKYYSSVNNTYNTERPNFYNCYTVNKYTFNMNLIEKMNSTDMKQYMIEDNTPNNPTKAPTGKTVTR